MVVIKKFVFNPFYENTYVIWDEETLEAIIIDPGCYDEDEKSNLVSFISERNLFLKYLILTHCHIDHVLSCKFIKEKYNPVYYAPEADMPLLSNVDKQGAAFGIEAEIPPMPDHYLNEETKIEFGESEIKILFTPGHSPGEHCLYFEKEEFCITGDVLFQNGIGRTDLWGGDYETLLNSIKNKLLILPDDVIIYPGHGEKSKIGIEKAENQFLTDVAR